MTLIPASRLPFAGTWTPHTSGGVGVPGGIPATRTMYVNAYSGALGGGGTYGGTLMAGNGTTNDGPALQAMIDACPANKYVYIQAGTYRVSTTVFIGTGGTKHNISIEGAVDGDGNPSSILDGRVTGGVMFHVGPGNGFVLPNGTSITDLAITSGVSKGSNQLTIGSTSLLSVGQMVKFAQDIDETVPEVSVGAYRYRTQQLVRVTEVTNATQFKFSPKLYYPYGDGAIACKIQIAHEQVNGIGIENLFLRLNESSVMQDGLDFTQAYGCWAKNVRVKDAVNYPINLTNSLQCEIRRCFIEPRNGAGTSGGGIYIDGDSSCLIEDNIVYDNWICSMMVNFGTSGCVFSRNFSTGPNFVDTNHGEGNDGNLYEGNVSEGFKCDGYFGYGRRDMFFNNKCTFITLYRFTDENTAIGNIITGAGSFTYAQGLPFFGNNDFTGTVDFPTTDWRDRNMHGTLTSVTKGTGSGYVVNHAGGYSAGATAIAVGSGTGTILVGDLVTFAGSLGNRYRVESFAGGVLTIGMSNGHYDSGLINAVAHGEAFTLSSDRGTITFADGLLFPPYETTFHVPVIHWDSGDVNYPDAFVGVAVTAVAGNVATIRAQYDFPNQVALPAAGTVLPHIGAMQDGRVFNEKDLKVDRTFLRKGNRYIADEAFDSMGGDTLPDSLIYTDYLDPAAPVGKPQWLLDAQTELGVTFNLRPFDPITPSPASDSDIPAGYRYTFLIPGEVKTAGVNTAGNFLSIGANKPQVVGPGGSVNAILNGTLTCPFSHISGSTMFFTTPRILLDGETFTVTLTNPAHGFRDVNGNDLPSITDFTVRNSSQENGGATWIQELAIADATIDYPVNNYVAVATPVTLPAAGNIIKVRVGIGSVNSFPTAGAKVALLATDRATVISTGVVTSVTVTNDNRSFSVSSVHAPSGGNYFVSFLYSGNPGELVVRGSPAASGTCSFSSNLTGYAAWPAATVPNDGPLAVLLSMGVLFAADEEGSEPEPTPRPTLRSARAPLFAIPGT